MFRVGVFGFLLCFAGCVFTETRRDTGGLCIISSHFLVRNFTVSELPLLLKPLSSQEIRDFVIARSSLVSCDAGFGGVEGMRYW